MNRFLLQDLDITPYAIGGVVYIIGATIYVVRLPERYIARKFDLLGASH